MKISIFITLALEIEKGKNKAKTKLSNLVMFTVIHLVILIVDTKFKD